MLGMNQAPAVTASALVVVVADLGSWQSTTESYLKWVRTAGFASERIDELEQKSKWAQWFFIEGWFGVRPHAALSSPLKVAARHSTKIKSQSSQVSIAP